MNNRQPIGISKITALYSRLSKDDLREGESLSIENQKAILEDYAKKQSFTNLTHYVDDADIVRLTGKPLQSGGLQG